MPLSLSKIASAFVTESRSLLNTIATLPKHTRWNNITLRKPRKSDWYAIQLKDDPHMTEDGYTVGHWNDNTFFLYGRHSSLSIRREIKNVQRWRPLSKAERVEWSLPDEAVAHFKR